MREILFRGLDLDNTWRCGDLICNNGYKDSTFIHFYNEQLHQTESCTVRSETIGQYTGLKDRNGNMIFEGDRVRFTENSCSPDNEYEGVGYVVYVLHDTVFGASFLIETENSVHQLCHWETTIEVISNIHDKEEK